MPFEPRFKDINGFLKKLICKNKDQRYNNFINIKLNPFFKDFQFEALLEFAYTPPYLPICKNTDIKENDEKKLLLVDYLKQKKLHTKHSSKELIPIDTSIWKNF